MYIYKSQFDWNFFFLILEKKNLVSFNTLLETFIIRIILKKKSEKRKKREK
jgi:hypothetical protein